MVKNSKSLQRVRTSQSSYVECLLYLQLPLSKSIWMSWLIEHPVSWLTSSTSARINIILELSTSASDWIDSVSLMTLGMQAPIESDCSSRDTLSFDIRSWSFITIEDANCSLFSWPPEDDNWLCCLNAAFIHSLVSKESSENDLRSMTATIGSLWRGIWALSSPRSNKIHLMTAQGRSFKSDVNNPYDQSGGRIFTYPRALTLPLQPHNIYKQYFLNVTVLQDWLVCPIVLLLILYVAI